MVFAKRRSSEALGGGRVRGHAHTPGNLKSCLPQWIFMPRVQIVKKTFTITFLVYRVCVCVCVCGGGGGGKQIGL